MYMQLKEHVLKRVLVILTTFLENRLKARVMWCIAYEFIQTRSSYVIGLKFAR